MSSDIQEVSNLKEILCRKKVAEIRKKYYKAEKRVCKKVLKNNDDEYEFLIKSSFVEFRKRYFSNLYNLINGIVNNSIGSIEGEMSAYISEKERSRTFEIISLIRSIAQGVFRVEKRLCMSRGYYNCYCTTISKYSIKYF